VVRAIHRADQLVAAVELGERRPHIDARADERADGDQTDNDVGAAERHGARVRTKRAADGVLRIPGSFRVRTLSKYHPAMKPHIFFRRVHYWASIPIAVPLLIIICTGMLLQLKKNLSWVQPTEQRAKTGDPALALPRVLEISRGVTQAQIDGWDDISRVEVRPGRGIIKVVSANRTEIQIDAHNGAVVQVAHRRSDLIESIHDGSWFHPLAKLGVFFPVSIVLLGMLLTGTYLFFVPILAKRRRARRDDSHGKGQTAHIASM
jgi:hypothetical protein